MINNNIKGFIEVEETFINVNSIKAVKKYKNKSDNSDNNKTIIFLGGNIECRTTLSYDEVIDKIKASQFM